MRSTAVALTGSNQTVAQSSATYCGFSIRETTGTAQATVRVWNGTSATGTLLDDIALSAGQSARELYPEGILADVGIFVQIVSGTVAGSLRVG
jgi:hypothetical protein